MGKAAGEVVDDDDDGGRLADTLAPPPPPCPHLTLLVLAHASNAASLVTGICVLPRLRGFNLVQRPVETLRLALLIHFPVVLLTYSCISVKSRVCSLMVAISRGLVGLPIGAIIAAFGAIVFGAPVELEYSSKTLHWSLLTSNLLILPTAIVFGQSWSDWQRLYAFTKPVGGIEYSICIPAHGAAIGAWLGAWPMPLDWDRPWQEWPVCVTYGLVGGYLLGQLVSVVLVLYRGQMRQKVE